MISSCARDRGYLRIHFAAPANLPGQEVLASIRRQRLRERKPGPGRWNTTGGILVRTRSQWDFRATAEIAETAAAGADQRNGGSGDCRRDSRADRDVAHRQF